MNPEMLDILIGKYLDSEITPAEQSLLDRELAKNPQAQSLLAQLQNLDQMARQSVQQKIADPGESFEAIFGRAMTQYQAGHGKLNRAVSRFGIRRTGFRLQSRWQLPIAVAAGFVLGLFSLFVFNNLTGPSLPITQSQSEPTAISAVPPSSQTDTSNPTSPDIVTSPQSDEVADNMPENQFAPVPQNLHQPELYTFTSPDGTQWLVAPHQNSDYALAGYTGDL